MAISKSMEAKWQAEDDARVMASYQEIVSDKARMSRAVKEAKRQAEKLTKRASMMDRAASGCKSSSRGTRRR